MLPIVSFKTKLRISSFKIKFPIVSFFLIVSLKKEAFNWLVQNKASYWLFQIQTSFPALLHVHTVKYNKSHTSASKAYLFPPLKKKKHLKFHQCRKPGFLLARGKCVVTVTVFFPGTEISEDCWVHAICGVHCCSWTEHTESDAQGRGRRRTHNQSSHGMSAEAPRFSVSAPVGKTSRLSRPCATRPSQENDLKKTVDESARIRRAYGHYFDQTIVNNNLDKAFDTLQDAATRLFVEPQWVPVSWVYWRQVWPLTTTEVRFITSPLWHWLSHKNCITKLSHLEGSGQSSRTLCNSLHTGSVLIYWHKNSFEKISRKTLIWLQCLVCALNANVAFVVL